MHGLIIHTSHNGLVGSLDCASINFTSMSKPLMPADRGCFTSTDHATITPVIFAHQGFVFSGLVVATKTADNPRTLNHSGPTNDSQPAALVTYNLRVVFLQFDGKRRRILPMQAISKLGHFLIFDSFGKHFSRGLVSRCTVDAIK